MAIHGKFVENFNKINKLDDFHFEAEGLGVG